MSQVTFKVAKLGQAVKEFFVENGSAKVSDALALAGYTEEGYDVRIGGGAVSMGSPIPNDSVITLIPKLKAGQ